jgi:hypothetical protein
LLTAYRNFDYAFYFFETARLRLIALTPQKTRCRECLPGHAATHLLSNTSAKLFFAHYFFSALIVRLTGTISNSTSVASSPRASHDRPLSGVDPRDHCGNIGAANSDVIKLGFTQRSEFLVRLMHSTNLDDPVNEGFKHAAQYIANFANRGVGIRALVLGLDD